jgi:glycosyltransferase involved in cell wall biosynthesis
MRFTIITPAFNCRQFLPRNLASVRAQRVPPEQLEHWVIDGGSKDGTVEYLQQQTDVKFISEPDRGLAHAVNKGIERAKGEWIIWLNADDELADDALAEFLKALPLYPDTYIFAGAQKLFGYDGTLERISEGWDYNLNDLLGRRTAIVQASTFVHRRVYDEVGLLDESYRYAMDYEWTVRAMHRFRCQKLATILTHYHRRPGSITDAGMPNSFRDILRVRRKYGRSRIEPAEWGFRFYIWTEPLRRIIWLRRGVRAIKGVFGHKPLHPVPPT